MLIFGKFLKQYRKQPQKKNHCYSRYVLICIDHFSESTWGVLSEDKEVRTLITQLNLIFHHFGKPEIFQADDGTEVRNRLLQTLCEQLGIKKVHGSIRHLQWQGAAEKLNDFAAKSLSKAFHFHQKSNDGERFQIEVALKAFVNNQNQEVHSKTGY